MVTTTIDPSTRRQDRKALYWALAVAVVIVLAISFANMRAINNPVVPPAAPTKTDNP